MNLPDEPGVYFFLGPKKEILYVGKATSLKDRVKSYFSRDLLSARGPLLQKMIAEARAIDYATTDSVLEALLLEANQIKKHKPVYNTRDKDDKSYNYVIITKEEYPRLLVKRGRELASKNLKIGNWKLKIAKQYGPFPHGGELREGLKIIRKIFPYRDEKCKIHPAGTTQAGNPCFPAQLGLCPGVCAGWMSKSDYGKRVRYIMKFFEGKKKELIKGIEKEMSKAANERRFEDAEKLKHTLYSLEHIQDVALIKRDIERMEGEKTFRVEAYDLAHISGKDTVGVMVAVEDGERSPSQYRKFRIRGRGGRVDINDIENLKEVLRRRLAHLEWQLPNLIVVDGGVAQMNGARAVIGETGFNIEVAAVVKDPRHKQRDVIGPKAALERHGKSILLANAEAHRFAIGYHRKLRSKGFRI